MPTLPDMNSDLPPNSIPAKNTPAESKSGPFKLLVEFFGLNRSVSIGIIVALGLSLVGAVSWFIWSAPPRVLTITSGPAGSLFHTNAVKYSQWLAQHGIRVKILTSHGSLENLQRLADRAGDVDIGFVQSGLATNGDNTHIVALGSVAYQPLMVFYRGAPVTLLSQLNGQRLAIGAPGSGTRTLALTLLELNGIKPGGATQLLDWEAEAAAQALLDGQADAVFLMGEAASSAILRKLLHTPGINLMNFSQATAYTRRLGYLNTLELAQGVIDFGNNLPPHDVSLIGPTVELLARDTLHPALSDLVLEAAREIHGNASLLQRKGEFPAPLEHEFHLSEDALRYYKSGKSFFYRHLPFYLASITSRIVVVFVPIIVVMIPIIRSIPALYRWRIRLRILRWYRVLLALERQSFLPLTTAEREHLRHRCEQIEQLVNKLQVPSSFADQFYGLRGHIRFVQDQLNDNRQDR